MPGTVDPLGGPQGFWATIRGLSTRIASLETWQRQHLTISPGTITEWGGPSAPPGTLLCDGSTFDPAAFPQLYAALGSNVLPTITTTPITVIWT